MKKTKNHELLFWNHRSKMAKHYKRDVLNHLSCTYYTSCQYMWCGFTCIGIRMYVYITLRVRARARHAFICHWPTEAESLSPLLVHAESSSCRTTHTAGGYWLWKKNTHPILCVKHGYHPEKLGKVIKLKASNKINKKKP